MQTGEDQKGMGIADIILLLIPLFSSLLLCLSLICLLDIKACWGPFITLCAVQIWVYVFSLFGLLYAGAMSIAVISVLFFIFTMFRKKEKAYVFKTLLSPGIVFFLLLSLAAIVRSYISNESFCGSDEISFWGLSYKITFLNGSLYPQSDFSYGPFSYPPIPQITWYSYTFLAPAIHEWYVKAMASMCIFAGMSTIFAGIRDDKKSIQLIKILAAFVLAYSIPLTQVKMGTYEFIYSDSMMAAWMAAILCIYFSSGIIPWQKVLAVCMGLFTLTLCKDMGMVLAAAAGAIIILDMFFCGQHKKQGNIKRRENIQKTKCSNGKKKIFIIFLLILSVLAARLSWNAYLMQKGKAVPMADVVTGIFKPEKTRTEQPSGPSQSFITDENVVLTPQAENNSAGNQGKNLWATFKKFSAKVLHYNTGIGSYPFILLCICAFMAGIAMFTHGRLQRRRLGLLIFGIVIASGFYLFCLFYVYYAYFPKAQLAYFAGYQRYIAPLPVAFLSLLAMLSLQSGDDNVLYEYMPDKNKTAGKILKWVITVVLLIAVVLCTPRQANPYYFNKQEPDGKRVIARTFMKQFASVMTPHKDKVFIIAQNDIPNAKTRLISSAAAYEYYPVLIINPSGPFAFDLPEKRDPMKTGNGDHYDIATYTVYTDINGMKAYIDSTDAAYLIVFKTDPDFIRNFGPAFSDQLEGVSECHPHLYQVNKTGKAILFELIIAD